MFFRNNSILIPIKGQLSRITNQLAHMLQTLNFIATIGNGEKMKGSDMETGRRELEKDESI